MAIAQEELHDFEEYVKKKVSENIYKDLINPWIDGIYNGYNHMNPPPDFAGMRLITKLHKKWKEGDRAVWITISPDHLKNPLKYNKLNLKRLSEFCIKWFTDKRYSFYHYVIETGKDKEDPHLHVHALVQFKHKAFSKNHAREIRAYWKKKMFHTLLPKDYYSVNVSGTYRDDKLEYMVNSAKGSHENWCQDPYEYEDIEGIYTRTRGELL